MGGAHGLAIGHEDGDGVVGRLDVGEGVWGCKVMPSATGVEDDGWGGA